MPTIEERVRDLEAWKAEITTKLASLRAFVVEHRKLYDEYRAEMKQREAKEAQEAEDRKIKERRRNAQT